MQALIGNSKYATFCILSRVFLVFYGANTTVTSWGSIGNYNNSNTVAPNSIDPAYLFGTADPSAAHASGSDDIWKILSASFSLDHKEESMAVKTAIRQLLTDKKKFYEILESAEPYLYFIHKQIQARGLPAELALIPAIESEFNPNDHSNKGATGLWQLMPGTAHELGIQVKSNYDGRRNVVASTNAALAYFRDLGDYYKGNWYLAIAAYNCGQATVESASRRAAGSRNFWNLRLPHETKAYLPKLLAVAAIIAEPEKYGVQLPPIHNKPYFSEVKLKKSVRLTTIAESIGISMDSLYTLNPDYKKHGIIANKNVYTLLVPVEYASAIQTQFSTLI